ncbi:FkbM family methyltransferase [Myxacorys almedinensis]|uniref:FkbM family methyltransferase n=1 Tax=Myxacorys almedinensis A TaxID=2690445 RepID=A0A8J8CLK6_9CYAN|nr:FkbM family methyltransferase [Myxacorys almedinensis]NDJ16217.1 FkbM family methyltransferase [Myxacorys almedinensis A]
MQLKLAQTPSRFQKLIIDSIGHLFRQWVKRGRSLFFWLVPNHTVFDYDFTVLNKGKPYSGNLKFGIDYQFFFSQPFEAQNVQILRTIADHLACQREAVHFLDVGANVGAHSHLLLDHVHSIHSFEPHPQIFQSLSAKWKACNDASWHIYPFGLGAHEGELKYYEPASHNTGTGSFVQGSALNHNAPITLPIRPGDRVLTEFGIDAIALMKIDVEGFEPFVLEGFADTLKRDRPIILMEMSVPTRQVLGDHHLSLKSLLYSDAVLVEIQPIGDRGDFRLIVKDFDTLNPSHHDLLVLPIEIANDSLKQLNHAI